MPDESKLSQEGGAPSAETRSLDYLKEKIVLGEQEKNILSQKTNKETVDLVESFLKRLAEEDLPNFQPLDSESQFEMYVNTLKNGVFSAATGKFIDPEYRAFFRDIKPGSVEEREEKKILKPFLKGYFAVAIMTGAPAQALHTLFLLSERDSQHFDGYIPYLNELRRNNPDLVNRNERFPAKGDLDRLMEVHLGYTWNGDKKVYEPSNYPPQSPFRWRQY